MYGENWKQISQKYQDWCTNFENTALQIFYDRPQLLYGEDHTSLSEKEKLDLIHWIAQVWVNALDNNEIKDTKKASLYKIITKAQYESEEENLPQFPADEVLENDTLLSPLHQLLLNMPRHQKNHKRYKIRKDGSIERVPRIPGQWTVDDHWYHEERERRFMQDFQQEDHRNLDSDSESEIDTINFPEHYSPRLAA